MSELKNETGLQTRAPCRFKKVFQKNSAPATRRERQVWVRAQVHPSHVWAGGTTGAGTLRGAMIDDSGNEEYVVRGGARRDVLFFFSPFFLVCDFSFEHRERESITKYRARVARVMGARRVRGAP